MKRFVLGFAILLLGFSTMTYCQIVRATGMGEAGIALTEGGNAYYNPAQIAFPTNDYKYYIQCSPGKIKFSKSYYGTNKIGYCGIFARINTDEVTSKLPVNIYAGYYRLGTYSRVERMTFDGPYSSLEIRKASTQYNAFVMGFSKSEKVDISGAYEISFRESKSGDSYNSETRLNYSFLIGFPFENIYHKNLKKGEKVFNIYLAVAHAWRNYWTIGSDVEKLAGASVKFSFDSFGKYGQISFISLLPAIEFPIDGGTTKVGLELGLAEALYLRIGRIGIKGQYFSSTIGLTLSSRGFARAIFDPDNSNTGVKRFLTQSMGLEFEFARKQNHPGSWSSKTLYGLNLVVY
ncbi:MAG: hypothetical protein V3V99_12400 [candidate division Zixibacteria bacterium]